jgi:outer membrane putative beta-barrel porin/alpha-amylase
MASGNGNADCGPGCKERYNAVGTTVNLTWGTGWKFLGADYYPTIQTGGYQATATTTPYPPGGGVLASPIYNNVFDHEINNIYFNPLNLSWNLGRGLYVAAGLGFVAPTGSTYAGSLVPDYWTVRPHAAVSYLGEGWNLTVSALYDINTASAGRTGLYQVIARNPATAPAVVALFTGPANPGRGYTSGNYLYVDWTATHKFGSWEFRPVGFFKFQTTDDAPGGINPATGSAWTCTQLTLARLPTCGKDVNRRRSLDRLQLWPGRYEVHLRERVLLQRHCRLQHRVGVLSEDLVQAVVSRRDSQEDVDHQVAEAPVVPWPPGSAFARQSVEVGSRAWRSDSRVMLASS